MIEEHDITMDNQIFLICFVVFFTLNFLLIFERSSGAVPFGTLVMILVLWFGISVPLAFLGSGMGQKS